MVRKTSLSFFPSYNLVPEMSNSFFSPSWLPSPPPSSLCGSLPLGSPRRSKENALPPPLLPSFSPNRNEGSYFSPLFFFLRVGRPALSDGGVRQNARSDLSPFDKYRRTSASSPSRPCFHIQRICRDRCVRILSFSFLRKETDRVRYLSFPSPPSLPR